MEDQVVCLSRRISSAARGSRKLLLAFALFGTFGCNGSPSGDIASSVPAPAPSPAPAPAPPTPPPPAPAPEPSPEPEGAPVTLSWDRPTLAEDGSSLHDLAGFKIYDGTSPANYSAVMDVGDVNQFTTDPYPVGTYYFSVTAYDSGGNESTFSNEVVVTISQDP